MGERRTRAEAGLQRPCAGIQLTGASTQEGFTGRSEGRNSGMGRGRQVTPVQVF